MVLAKSSQLLGKILTSGVLVLLLAANIQISKADDTEDIKGGHQILTQIFHGSGWLGVALEDVGSENMARYHLSKEQGVIVKEVQKDSPAERAGLRQNDVILLYAENPILSVRQFTRLVHETPVGRTVTLVVSRDGSQETLNAKIEERKALIPKNKIRKSIDLKGLGLDDFNLHDLPFGKHIGTRSRLGIQIQTLTDQMADFLGVSPKKGVLVTGVIEGSPAAKAGIKAGDVIVGIDGNSIEGAGDLQQSLKKKQDADQVTVNVIRDKRPQTIKLQLEQAKRQRGVPVL